jgi:hypothetical protein
MKSLFLFGVAALGMLAGCTTTTRAVTHINWYEEENGNKAYIAYWEGECSGMGCDRGVSRIKLCSVQADNSMDCKAQGAADKLLNPHVDSFPAEPASGAASEAPAAAEAPAEVSAAAETTESLDAE